MTPVRPSPDREHAHARNQRAQRIATDNGEAAHKALVSWISQYVATWQSLPAPFDDMSKWLDGDIGHAARTPVGGYLSALTVAIEAAGLGDPVSANLRHDPILPATVAMIDPGKAKPAQIALFSPAAHVVRDGWLPGFERDVHGPALPLALYDLMNRDPKRRGPAADMGLRVFVEGVLTVMQRDRPAAALHPVTVSTTLRDFLTWFYGDRTPRPNEYWPLLMEAGRALDRHEARFPWHDPMTGKGGLRRVVSLSDIPRGPGALDDLVSLTVHLPPGTQTGPVVNRPRLRYWGRRSEPAYRALLGLAYRWFRPGVTRIPANRRKNHWLQAQDPSRYEPLTDDELIDLCYPTSASGAKRDLLQRSRKTIKALVQAGDMQQPDARRPNLLLPPAPSPMRMRK